MSGICQWHRGADAEECEDTTYLVKSLYPMKSEEPLSSFKLASSAQLRRSDNRATHLFGTFADIERNDHVKPIVRVLQTHVCHADLPELLRKCRDYRLWKKLIPTRPGTAYGNAASPSNREIARARTTQSIAAVFPLNIWNTAAITTRRFGGRQGGTIIDFRLPVPFSCRCSANCSGRTSSRGPS